MFPVIERLGAPGPVQISGAPEGYDALVLASVATVRRCSVVFVARDAERLARTEEALAFFAPDLPRLTIPAWDCLPYDRVSPKSEVVSERIESLSRLAGAEGAAAQVVLTTVSAALQRVPPRDLFRQAMTVLQAGSRIERGQLVEILDRSGYQRTETVLEPGEFATRGSIIDIFPPGCSEPRRLDFFDVDLESIRAFDPASQRSTDMVESITIKPVSEVILDPDTIARFRSGYRALFGAVTDEDPLYAAVSAGRRYIGIEHWLPLFHDHLDTLFDYLPDAIVVLDDQADAAIESRLELIEDYFTARRDLQTGGTPPYRPVPPQRLFLNEAEWTKRLSDRPVGILSGFAPPDHGDAVDAGGRPALDFSTARGRSDVNVFDALAERIEGHARRKRRVIIAAVSQGSRARLMSILRDHGLKKVADEDTWDGALSRPAGAPTLVVLEIERGYVADDHAVITEQDILGDRLVRRAARGKRPENVITEASALTEGDLVVHADHGIGRYEGLETIQAAGAAHDCLRLIYSGGDKLYLPVENIELVSRFGSDSGGVQLDRLGAANWQARKAKLKKRIRDMAQQLIQIAAARTLKTAPVIEAPEGLFDEFCARFPYTETDDQARAIDDTIADLATGQVADRLVCGDVGFGKTEVALRAAFLTAMAGHQVAVVVPTTLLSRQHYQTFVKRFEGYPIRIAQLSRLVQPKDAKLVKAGLANGTTDIVVGTHALLSKSIRFRDLALLIVDEEQHFGVAHKEALKKLKEDVHVLTLTATPIPRTLQLALSGVRQMSLIATPPVDRLAVRTFVLPFDPVVIREAIMRERFRGGQTFYVCPRIEDLGEVEEALRELVPEVKIIRAHGRLAAKDLEAAVGAFYEGTYDVLLSTNIVESGLDLPAVNTIVIHRADMFGLAQLYQLRGRVGRSKVRAYAYLTLPPKKKVTPTARQRLDVMQALDSLGAGFTLASHDLDIRGAGNLLGEEQSGHIREVGIELYQRMLEDAVAEARGGGRDETEAWSPQINVGISVLIPENYVPDLGIRLGLYRRLADLEGVDAIDGFAAELVDRFGPLPNEVENLLQIVAVKQFCRTAGVDRVEAGPKGAVVTFRNNQFANPAGLVGFIGRQASTAKLRPDHRLVYKRDWEVAAQRLAGVRRLTQDLAKVATAA